MLPLAPQPLPLAKRFFDIVGASILLILSTPLTVTFLFLIATEHLLRGRLFDPLLYTETRWSEGKPFTLFKFNIFKHDIITAMRARGEFIHTKDLERNGSLLSVGWLLKQVYLDELPQLYNVLQGDMSIVGPRPMNSLVREKLLARGNTAKEYIRAGMTGYYQACHKSEQSGASQEVLDREYLLYVRDNPWYKVILFDLYIIAKTIKVLLMARGI